MSGCFKYFTYDGKSTETIISTPLILASFNRVDSILGVSRDAQKGETTITRPIPNEYGIVANSATIEYCLMKNNFEPFTAEEQIDVERWLTSPKYSHDLVVYDADNNEICIYCGLFTNTSWIPHSKGYSAVEFTFECNSAYPSKKYIKEYSIDSSGSFILNCESDELNEYIYPILTIYERSETATVTVTNVTDDENSMVIRAYDRLRMTFDCQHCIPKDTTNDGVISYADLGWEDVGNIYWLRLLPGDNEIQINVDGNSTVDITLEYRCPYKLVGGWL